MALNDKMTLAPLFFQRMPDPQSRCFTNVLQTASVTPDPIGKSFSICAG